MKTNVNPFCFLALCGCLRGAPNGARRKGIAPSGRPLSGRPKWMGALIVIVLAMGVCSIASAHAFLDHAQPRVGSKVPAAPEVVKIWFTQELESAFSSIKVFDSGGNEVDKKDTHQDDKDKKLLIVSLSSLPPGEYKVAWQVVSVDTHRTSGDFKFRVQP
jgi:methionine-rich copper-binding protein CopC